MIEALEAIAHDRRLPKTALYVALALARSDGEDGAGLAELSAATGMSEATVTRAVRAMRDRGHIITSPATAQQRRRGASLRHHALAPLSLQDAWERSPPATRMAFVRSVVGQPAEECA